MNDTKKEYWKDDKQNKIERQLTLEEYSRKIESGNLSDDAETVLELIKIYHPDRFNGEPHREELAKKITDKLLK